MVWEPDDKSGLQFWFKADAITGLNDGDAISTWVDSSVNARDATQAGGNRPTFQTNELNGKPGVNFANGSSQFMEFGTANIAATGTPFSIVYVGYCTFSGNSQFRSLISVKTATAGVNFIVFMSGTTPATNYANTNIGFGSPPAAGWKNGTATNFATTAASGIFLYNGTNDSSANNYSGYKNGVALTMTGAPVGNFNSGGNNKNYLGHFPTAGAGLSWDGMIFEIFGYNATLSAGDLTDIAAYTLARYGI